MNGTDVRNHLNFLADRAKALQGEMQGLLGMAYGVDMPAILQGCNLSAKLAEHLQEIAGRPMPASAMTLTDAPQAEVKP